MLLVHWSHKESLLETNYQFTACHRSNPSEEMTDKRQRKCLKLGSYHVPRLFKYKLCLRFGIEVYLKLKCNINEKETGTSTTSLVRGKHVLNTVEHGSPSTIIVCGW